MGTPSTLRVPGLLELSESGRRRAGQGRAVSVSETQHGVRHMGLWGWQKVDLMVCLSGSKDTIRRGAQTSPENGEEAVVRGQQGCRRECGRHSTGNRFEATRSEAVGAWRPHCVCFPPGRTESVDRSGRPFFRAGRVGWWLAAGEALVRLPLCPCHAALYSTAQPCCPFSVRRC